LLKIRSQFGPTSQTHTQRQVCELTKRNAFVHDMTCATRLKQLVSSQYSNTVYKFRDKIQFATAKTTLRQSFPYWLTRRSCGSIPCV